MRNQHFRWTHARPNLAFRKQKWNACFLTIPGTFNSCKPVPEGLIWAVYSKITGFACITVLNLSVWVCNMSSMPPVLTLQSSCPARDWRGVSWRWRWPGRPWCGSCLWGLGRCSPHTQAVDPWAPTLRWALPAVERGQQGERLLPLKSMCQLSWLEQRRRSPPSRLCWSYKQAQTAA